MDCSVTFDDSMKIYLTEVLHSCHIHPCVDGSTAPSPANQKDAMRTLASRDLYLESLGCEQWTDHIRAIIALKNYTYKLADLLHNAPGTTANVLALVKETFPIKEIWVKRSRRWATHAMLVFCDLYGFEIELLFWGMQCRHLLSLKNGSMMCVKDAIISEFQGRKVLRIGKASSIIKLGPVDDIMKAIKEDTSLKNLYEVCSDFKSRYSNLCIEKASLIQDQQGMAFSKYQDLSPGKIQHIRAKLASISAVEANVYDNSSLRCVIKLVGSSDATFLYLHGSSKLWRRKLVSSLSSIWEFSYLACVRCSENDSLELHTTIISSARLYCLEYDPSSIVSVCNCYEELSNCVPINEINLHGVVTDGIIVKLNHRMYTLTKQSPDRVVEKLIKKYIRLSSRLEASVMASCHFMSDSLKRKFVVKIQETKWDKLSLLSRTLLHQLNIVHARWELADAADCEECSHVFTCIELL